MNNNKNNNNKVGEKLKTITNRKIITNALIFKVLINALIEPIVVLPVHL